MKFTEQRSRCQHCGERPATLTITWHWEAGVDIGVEHDHDDEEDWCLQCAAAATGPITNVEAIIQDEGRRYCAHGSQPLGQHCPQCNPFRR